jgi:hypothetical protein
MIQDPVDITAQTADEAGMITTMTANLGAATGVIEVEGGGMVGVSGMSVSDTGIESGVQRIERDAVDPKVLEVLALMEVGET